MPYRGACVTVGIPLISGRHPCACFRVPSMRMFPGACIHAGRELAGAKQEEGQHKQQENYSFSSLLLLVPTTNTRSPVATCRQGIFCRSEKTSIKNGQTENCGHLHLSLSLTLYSTRDLWSIPKQILKTNWPIGKLRARLMSVSQCLGGSAFFFGTIQTKQLRETKYIKISAPLGGNIFSP